jgi:hypothetical protein
MGLIIIGNRLRGLVKFPFIVQADVTIVQATLLQQQSFIREVSFLFLFFFFNLMQKFLIKLYEGDRTHALIKGKSPS